MNPHHPAALFWRFVSAQLHRLRRASHVMSALALLSGAAHADPASTIIVLDGSGSMWAKLANEPVAKVDIIRERLLMNLQLAPQTRIAVSAFGQRRRGDCSDVENLATFATPRAEIDEVIQKFDPRGKGPLVQALRSASALIDDSRPMSILAFADGADNCRQDPCAFATEFAASHPGVPIHLVAIGVGPKHRQRLICIPELTGGDFWNAGTAAEITTAIDAAAKIAMQAPEQSAPGANAADPTAAPAPPGVAMIRANVVLAEGKPVYTKLAQWRVRQRGSETIVAQAASVGLSVPLEPGDYDVEARIGQYRASTQATVRPAAATDVSVAMNLAHLQARALAVKGGKALPSSMLTIEPASANTSTAALATGMTGALDMLLPPGTYILSAIEDATRVSQQIQVAAGDETTADLLLETGTLELTASTSVGAEPLTDVIFIVTRDDPESPDGRREVVRSRAPKAHFALPAGTYYVTVKSGQGASEERIAISAGDKIARTLVLPLVDVTVSARIASAPANTNHGIVFRVLTQSTPPVEITRSLDPQLSLRLRPGKYTIAALLDAHRLSAKRDVQIKDGEPVDITIDFNATEVTLTSANGDGRDRFWQIMNASGDVVWRGKAAEPIAVLAPGRYTVSLEQRNQVTKAAFEAKLGEKTTIRIGPSTP